MSELYGLIGEKLGHSFSPAIHSQIMKKLNLAGYYHLFEVNKENLAEAVKALKVLKIKGVNVTIPYKVEVMNYLEEISAEAQRIGAVNTIYFKGEKSIGFNTDYYGFGLMLEKFGINVLNSRAVVLGSGGAASSVVHYLKDKGAREVVLVSRDINSAKEKFPDLKFCTYGELKSLKGYELIINCTPCGMYPNLEESLVGSDVVKNFSVAVDLIYNPAETLFLKQAKAKGLKTIGGLYMLVGQAVKAQEIWNEVSIPENIIDQIYQDLAAQISWMG